MAGKHSVLGASSTHRWFHCPGSARLCDSVPNISSDYSHEGTAAHHLAEELLSEKKVSALWAGDLLDWDICLHADGCHAILPPGMSGSHEPKYTIDKEMAEAVDLYIKTVRDDLAASLDASLLVEHKFKLTHLHESLWGTNDACVIDAFDGVLRVYDLKYGVGVPVEVSEGGKPNPQLAYYALGGLDAAKNLEFKEVELVIVQPRARHSAGPVRRFGMTTEELLRWSEEVLLPAVARTEEPNAPLVAGEWCKSTFCRARSVCPEMRKMACEVGGCEFDEDIVPVSMPTLPAPHEIPPEKMGRLLDFISLLEPWMKDFKAYAKETRIRGVDIGGWKIVETRATRKWINEQEVQRQLLTVLRQDLLETRVKTPAQVEKALKDLGMKKDTIRGYLEGLVEETRGTTLAPMHDKREEVLSAAIEFDDDPFADPFAE